MTVYHDAVAALPIPGYADKTLLRNVVTARMPYVLADSDDVTNLIAVDPSTGSAIIDFLFLGRVFHYDPTDTTTANDGVSCLVSSDGRRYKLAAGTDVFAYAVLDNTIATPPGSPTLGDSYLIAAAATGTWAGKDGYVTVRTKRGWEFINFGIGRMIYVESVESYYHKSSLGVWTAGFGANALAANSVPITAIIGAKASFIIKVENQTTNTPPGSPTVGTAYIIGPSPTGAWAGAAQRLAICLVAGSFAIIAPLAGDQVYDKALGATYMFNNSAWVSGLGAWKLVTQSGLINTGITAATGGSGFYGYNATVAPTSTNIYSTDTATALSYTARSGALLRLTYSADSISTIPYILGLHIDGASAASDWCYATPQGIGQIQHSFYWTAADASSHSYAIRLYEAGSGSARGLYRRRLVIEEAF